MSVIHKKPLSTKQFNTIVLILTMILFILISVLVIGVDPCFHYHIPLDRHNYPIFDGRYQNNGIARNFKYNAIVTGTSMTENFKTSELNKLFDVNAVKMPYSGGTYHEIGDNLAVALECNPDIKIVVLGMDYNTMLVDKDRPFPAIADNGYQYPWYITDDNVLNDINYFMNKDMILRSINIMATSGNGVSFDTAYYWGGYIGIWERACTQKPRIIIQ